MTNPQRFYGVLNGKKVDRVPIVEWATWWDKTIDRWHDEGLPRTCQTVAQIADYFGHDPLQQLWLPIRESGFPSAPSHGAPVLQGAAEYQELKRLLYTDGVMHSAEQIIKESVWQSKDNGTVYWMTLEGFFWFPRTLLGIENHLYAFYDEPELLHTINRDLCDFYKRLLPVVYEHVTPAFMTFAEDMSYNLGPMLSKEQYEEFVLPYYLELVSYIKEKGTKVLIDTDGNVEPLIPWFLKAGIEGVLPLERMAGVDINRIREQYPDFILIGGFDKTIMHLGEQAMRAEFERLLPVIRSGRYIPSVDHQTPPDVSLENYRIYTRLLREYCGK